MFIILHPVTSLYIGLTFNFQLDRSTSQSISSESESSDPNDIVLNDIDPFSNLLEETKFEIYHSHKSASDIQYKHEGAIQEAKKMLAVLSTLLDSMELGTLRRDIWKYDIDRYCSSTISPASKSESLKLARIVSAILPCPI